MSGRECCCEGYGWVCADHPNKPWADSGLPKACRCGAEGTACVCNPDNAMPPGTQVYVSTDAGDYLREIAEK